GLPALPVLLTRGEADVPPWAVLLGVVPLLLLLWPPLLNLGIRIGLRLLRQPPLEQPLGPRAVARSCLWWAVSWGMGGVSVWVLTRALAPEEVSASRLALIAICGYLLAAGVSMLSIVVPAGVGVREGVLGLLLTTEVSLPAATAVVVVARLLTVVVDIVVAAAGWGWPGPMTSCPSATASRPDRVEQGGEGPLVGAGVRRCVAEQTKERRTGHRLPRRPRDPLRHDRRVGIQHQHGVEDDHG